MSQANQIIVQVQNQKDYQKDDEIEGGTHQTTLPDDQQQSQSNQNSISRVFNLLCSCLYIRSFLPSMPLSRDQTLQQIYNKKPSFKVPDQVGRAIGLKTLILDLDETLVHSQFSPVANPDLQFNLSIDGNFHSVFVRVRPGAQLFIKMLSLDYEVVIYTASLSEYADPVIDFLDPFKVVSLRLYRENCTFHKNAFVKDLSLLNRDMKNIIIVDNSVNSFLFQPMNAFHIRDFFDDMEDQELFFIIPFFRVLKDFNDVRDVLEWQQKFYNCEEFTYINTVGKKIVYQLKEEDLYIEDSARTIKQYLAEQSARTKIYKSNDQDSDTKNSSKEVPMFMIETPKAEDNLPFIKKAKKQKEQRSIIISRFDNPEFDINEKQGMNTERIRSSKDLFQIRNGKDKLSLRCTTDDSVDVDDSQLRLQYNLNSPKDENQAQSLMMLRQLIIFQYFLNQHHQVMMNTKTQVSVKKHYLSPTFLTKTLQNNQNQTAKNPQAQKFTQAIQQKNKQRDQITHLSTQSACSSQDSRQRPVFQQDQRSNFVDFGKLITNSLQKHSFLSSTSVLPIQQSRLKQDQRKSLSQMLDNTDRQKPNQKRVKEVFRQKTQPRSQTRKFTHSTNPINNDLTQSPKQSVVSKTKTPSQLFTQINSLLQSAHSGQLILQSPPNSGQKRINGNGNGSICYLRSSLSANLSFKTFQSSNEMIKSTQSQYSQPNQTINQISNLLKQSNSYQGFNVIDEATQTKDLLKRFQTLLTQQHEEKQEWKNEKEYIILKLMLAEQELDSRINAKQQEQVQSDQTIIDVTDYSPIHHKDQSFG